jgi:MtN3 and saliva related transmembrane protein
MIWSIIGTAAAVVTTSAFFAQIAKLWKTRSSKDLSVATLLQLSLGALLWTAYGVHLRDPIIAAPNLVTLVTLVITLILYFRYRQ